MIIFHEGLPGSGKSYEAVVKHILPALSSGREVYAYIEGLNYPKIAELLGVDEGIVRSLLYQVERDNVSRISEVISNNSLVVIDELASFWPNNKKVSGSIADFIKEHRHIGVDILVIDQDLRDCHAIWKRRVDQKVQFMKLDMLGASSKYKWTLFKAVSGENFEKINSGVSVYDSRYFGSYNSHVSDDVNSGNYVDSRSVLWRSKWFLLGLVFVLLVIALAPWYLLRFFDPGSSPLVSRVNNSVVVPASRSDQVVPRHDSVVAVSAGASSGVSVKKPDVKPNDFNLDYIGDMSKLYRVRLVTVLASYSRAPYVVVEFRDASYRVYDRFDSSMLADLGWSVEVKGLRLVVLRKKGQLDLIATPWPLEPFGEVSDRQNQAVRDASIKGSTGL